MALKILIADPRDEWLPEAKKHFQALTYEVDAVNNGRDAQLQLYNNEYFAIILNIDLQNHSGLQVLKFIKSSPNFKRVIMLINIANKEDDEEVDIVKLKKLGVTEIVEIPCELQDLQNVLEGHQSIGDMISNLPKREGASEEVEVNDADENYTKVRIDDFYSTKAVLFDVYIKLGSGRFVKILHAGDAFDKERIDKYKNDKKVEYLWFHNKDRNKYIKYHNYLANKVIENDRVQANAKVKLLNNLSSKYIEEAYTEGMKPLVIEQGKEICENVYKLVEGQKDLYKALKSFQDFDPNAYTHAFLNTLYSSVIIKQFDWQSKITIENTALACMFHDIGKMKLPKELLEKRPHEMTEEELEEYKKHPELGLEIIEGNYMINNSVKQIILQHHEYFDGTGFPHKKRGSKILTLANIVCLSDDFVHLMVDKNLKPTEALRAIISDSTQVKKYNSLIIASFIKVFVDPGKIKKDSVLPSNSKVVNKKAS